MTIAELKKIALHAAKGTVPTEFANQDIDVNAAFVDGLKELAGSVSHLLADMWSGLLHDAYSRGYWRTYCRHASRRSRFYLG